MKIAKKLLGIALAACMVLTILQTAAFAYTGGVFENGDTFTLRTTAKLSGNITVSDYTIGGNSVKWANNDSAQATFNAWYPTCGDMDSDVTVKTLKVSTSAKPDLMMAAPVQSTRTGGVTLQFRHVMHRLVVNLSKDSSVPDNLNDATIALKNMDGNANVNFSDGTVVGSNSGDAYPARGNGAAIIIAPQTLQVGSDWIEVRIGTDYAQTFKVPVGSTDFLSGQQTILNLQLQSDGIIFVSQTVMPWDANGDGSEDVSTVTLDIASVPALTAPTNPGWANSTPGIAKWDAVDNASGYTVQLYKDLTLVDTSDAGTALEYNFTSKIATTGNGDYIFNVQARGNGTTFPDSPWSAYSAKYVYVKPAETSTDTYVLINGVKWATRNVAAPGTFAASPEAASMFYQWNSKVGWSSADPLTASDGSSTWDSTWNGGFDSPSGSDTWIAANDPSPAGYRVPTMAELQTLEDSEHVTKTWTSLNGVQVWRFTDKTTNQFIYLPALGFRRDSTGELATVNTHGIYWSSTAYDGFALAWNTGGPGGSSRANGFLVRPVLAADFAASTDSSTANDTATLGLVGTSVVSSAAGIATAAISDGHIAITSVSAGAATITVTDGASHSATIGVTVNHDGSVTLGTITKYVLAAPGNPVWDDATSSHIAKWDAVADAAVYRVVFYNGNKQIGDVIETGTVTQYDFTSAITAAGYGSFTFEVQVKVNSGAFSRWSDRSAVLPLFSPVTSVEVSPTTATVQKGATKQFTATVNATAGTAQTVTWELVGNTSANTSVSADGLLTVGADETGTILNVTAVSTVDISKSSTAAVVVPSVETLVNTLSNFGLTADVSGNTVTVTGTKVATDTLVLTIPTGVKVLWNASLTGAADAPLILLNGAGIFELAGGEIVNTGTGGALSSWDTSLVISDGTASSSSDFATVMTYYRSENPPTITMTGGNVISTSEKLSSCAISAGGNTVITGGTVTAQDGNQVVLSNAVVVYRSGLLTKINSGSLSASIAVSPSKTYATPTETDGLTATGYSATTGNVTAKWAVLYPGEGTGVWVDYTYSGTGSGTWRVSYPAVQVVSGKHLLTYNSNGGEGATPFSIVYKGQSYTVGNNVFTRTNYTFTGWNTEADGTGTPYAAGATLIGGPGSEDILLFAQWLYTGSGKTGDSSGGGAVTTPSTSKPTTSGDTTSVTTEVKPTTSGTTANATVSKETMTSAIDAAMDAAEKSKTTANVTLAVAAAKDVTAISATVPVASVNKLSDAKADGSLTLQTPLGSVTLDNSALTSIADKAVGSEVSVSIAKVDSKSLTTAQQALVGDRPVIDLTVTSGGKNISNLGGIATVSVPYTPAVGEDTSHLVVWYLADNGSLTPMDCSYSNGKLTFSTTHFSKYVVAQFPFSDVKGGDWFYTSVAAMQAKGLMNGISSDSFAPQATTTRGMIVTMLHRLANQPETTANVSFSDTESSAYYFNAVKWANDKGIVKGVSDDEFAPNGSATREQLVTILYRYAGSPAVSTPTDMSKFSDADKISDFAAQPFAWAIQKGIISGNTDGTLNPTGTATRAEIATMFNNYISVK